MSADNVTPIRLTPAQVSGIAGVKEQLERTFALITGALTMMNELNGDHISEPDLRTPIILLGMAMEEVGNYRCLKRIEDARFEG